MATARKKRWTPKSEDRQSAMFRLADEGRRDDFIARLRAELGDSGRQRSETGLLRCEDSVFRKILKEFPPRDTAAEKPVEAPKPKSETWPFFISQEKASLQLIDGASRDSKYADDVAWVGTNIGNQAATPKDAPSNAAWQILVTYSTSESQRKAFYKDHYKPVMEKRGAELEDAIQRRTQVKINDLLDQFEGWRNCPHCGENVFDASPLGDTARAATVRGRGTPENAKGNGRSTSAEKPDLPTIHQTRTKVPADGTSLF